VKKLLLSLTILIGAGFGLLHSQVALDKPFKIVRLDPALDDILAPDAKLEVLGEHFGLTEGPVWVRNGQKGYLLFSDCAANVIYKWASGDPLSVFLEKSRLEKDGTRTVLADRYDGKRFSGPNDVAIKSDGAIYFTDSVFGIRGGADSPARELPYNGFYLIKDGKVTLLGSDKNHPGEFPNGIALSPDEKVLYVTAGLGKTMRYDVLPDDTVTNGSLFIPAGNDGMKTDLKGNLYSTNAVSPGEVWITSKDGKHLGTIQMPQSTQTEPRPRIVPTNVAFGDADGKSLYITACTHLFRIRLRTAGILPGPKS
jgi:gluconolactonase